MSGTRSEAQVRFELVDPVLIDQRGWSRSDIHVEETVGQVDIVYHKGQRRPKGRTDYVLRHPLAPDAPPIPLAIMETKRENLPPEHGLQQGKDYRIGHLHHVPFVFSSNGHLFVEYHEATGAVSEPRPMCEFPTPGELVQRYLAARGLAQAPPQTLQLLVTPYAQGRGILRYYQDAAIRAALEAIILRTLTKKRRRLLLSLATGSGKTRLAAALLRLLFDAGLIGKALFVCDRTELRDNGLADFQAAFGNDAAEVSTRHPQKNARVLIATYQTLANEQEGADPAADVEAFFKKHYPPGYFDIIIIDECHRSAWGKWRFILDQNADGIHVGLTATPRKIRLPKVADPEARRRIEEAERLLADNYRYFGEPVYEYPYQQGVEDGYLAPAEIECYEIYHDDQTGSEAIRGVYRSDLADKHLTYLLTGQQALADDAPNLTAGPGIDSTLILPDRVRAMSAHLFGRILANGDGDPLQKTIVFCASDHHADQVTNELNRLYAEWCRANGQKRIQKYAFKCMASVDGQALIPDFRGRQRSHIIATTKDLLTTGVNVPCVRNIVFFRYIESPILFHQMVGRGSRIDEGTGKLMFRIYDYTGATALYGADFVTPLPPEPPLPGPPPPPPEDKRIRAKGFTIRVTDGGRFNLMTREGRLTRVTPEEYQQQLIQELLAAVPTLADFRARWLDPAQRQELLAGLLAHHLNPELLREAAHMEAYDEFDVLAALAYRIAPLTRAQRAAKFGDAGPDWLVQLPKPAAKVIRKIVKQFEQAGTGALETGQLWQTIGEPAAIESLRQGGPPAELLRKTKETLFAA
jgi:type I restriction enzyme R subunit